MGDTMCVVCRRRAPTRGAVCDPDRDKLAELLADLPRKFSYLGLHLVPGGGTSREERVSTSRVGSPVGARMDALTLVGPGSDRLSAEAYAGMLYPKIRRWQTVEIVTVVLPDGRQSSQPVTTWHQEPVVDADGRTVHGVHDDQVGLLPPVEWLAQWARTWRTHYGHEPETTGRRRPGDVAGMPRPRPGADVVLGLVDGHAGTVKPQPGDPTARELDARYTSPGLPLRDFRYLAKHLDRACDDDVYLAEFANELRTLSAELARVLGEQPDQQYLGRCPALLRDRQTPSSPGSVCGASLWHDPYVLTVTCPRCHSAWGPQRTALLHLASQIRRVWPIDRHRRYQWTEIEQLPGTLTCPACEGRVNVTWREVTGRGETVRTWRPDQAVCVNGCLEARKVI